tara:strand:+ start:1980 stop:2567 length:588 start_codon:yes stop_codon:yes gene_type:complete
MSKLKNLESFMQLLHAVQNIERVARIPNETKRRNTAEHTFELAMVCWYIVEENNLDLNKEKIFKYALAHDVIEAYAGDTPAHDVEAQKHKKGKEAQALLKIEEKFSHFVELIETIHAYEARNDMESIFVYATDKLIDPLNASMETKQSIWKEMDMSYEYLRLYKDEKIALSSDVQPYWEQLCKKLEANKDFFFHE